MNTVLFVFALSESRVTYKLLIDTVEGEYGYLVKVVSLEYYREEMDCNADEYSAVLSDFKSDDPKLFNMSDIPIDKLLSEINVICVNR